jgi:hypothetical protein
MGKHEKANCACKFPGFTRLDLCGSPQYLLAGKIRGWPCCNGSDWTAAGGEVSAGLVKGKSNENMQTR